MKKRSSFEITRAVILALVLREMRGRFGRVRMGVFWTLAEPLIHLLFISLVMSTLMGRHIAGYDYPLYLIVGLAPFLLFRNTATGLMGCVDANRGLFAYKQIAPLDTFVARTLVEVGLASVVYITIIAGFAWWGYDVSISHPLEWIATLVLGLIMSFGLGVFFAVVAQQVPETRLFIRMCFMPLYLLSGIIVPVSRFPEEMMPFLLLNPFLHLVELLRGEVFPFYTVLDGVSAFYVVEFTVVTLAIAFSLYRLRRRALLAI